MPYQLPLLIYDTPVSFSRLLRDLDITTISSRNLKKFVIQEDANDPIPITTSFITETCGCIPTALTTFDKLLMREMHDLIIRLPPPTIIPIHIQIINHALSFDALTVAYRNGYKVVHNNMYPLVSATYCTPNMPYPFVPVKYYENNVLKSAIANGLLITRINTSCTCNGGCVVCCWGYYSNSRVLDYFTSLTELRPSQYYGIATIKSCAKNLRILECEDSFTDADLASCTSLTELYNPSNKIITFDPFAKTLRKLCLWSTANVTDAQLALCTSLTELNAGYNRGITTCAPFASSLRILTATGTNIDDTGLQLCHNIEILHPSDHITTCEPFAKSLISLHAKYGCNICDDGMRSCTSLKMLYISSDSKITTFAPFANSLQGLILNYDDSITNAMLRSCISLTTLNISENRSITTCEPFARTLTTLYARRYTGIRDIGLRKCTMITKLDADDNKDITTCAPFANTLRILNAARECGIGDEGLRLCTKIRELYALCNQRITTCEPFAKTLRKLNACDSCGITDNGLRLCTNIRNLRIWRNKQITTCRPFANTLHTLYANIKCNIIENELETLCPNLKILRAYNLENESARTDNVGYWDSIEVYKYEEYSIDFLKYGNEYLHRFAG